MTTSTTPNNQAADAAFDTTLIYLLDAPKPSLNHLLATVHVPGSLLVQLHGEWYDMQKFVDVHPGGVTALRLAAGRDATALFESSHVFADKRKLDALLAKYRLSHEEVARRGIRTLESGLVRDNLVAAAAEMADKREKEVQKEKSEIKKQTMTQSLDTGKVGRIEEELFGEWTIGQNIEWSFDNEFRQVLLERVRNHFKAEAKRRGVSLIASTKATPAKWALILFFGVFWITSTVMLVKGYYSMLVLCPLFSWLCGVNVFHDALHFALTTNPKFNEFCGALFPFFSSPFAWNHEHVVGHHVHTNMPYHDPDVAHGPAIRREHKAHRHEPIHSSQASFKMIALHFVIGTWLGLGIGNDYKLVFSSSKSYNGFVPRMPVYTSELVQHVIVRTAYVLVTFTWPFFVFPAGTSVFKCLLFAIAPLIGFSCLFMLNTQINHLTPSAMKYQSKDWTVHQIITAQNFGDPEKNDVAWWFHFIFSGGLCLQMEHHIFPTVNHCHLPAVAKIVKATCKEYGVPYTRVNGYYQGMKEYIQHTHDMSIPPLKELKLKSPNNAPASAAAESATVLKKSEISKTAAAALRQKNGRTSSVDLSAMLPLLEGLVAPVSVVASLVDGKKDS
ncbi:hypothetical protein CcCBS67573_g07874 [Chytriomyces confervae]|uniref:Cytochrome b5 heme-binding domain-containing protein n=1 Tax=Chytriomyces confervae TaxID=246404 RepID=A0A507ESN6_9FUNG|nr:hypothetical protein CcCBS67573_g07874 [Chytriomyces confervae]